LKTIANFENIIYVATFASADIINENSKETNPVIIGENSPWNYVVETYVRNRLSVYEANLIKVGHVD
jgi:hypothetical protein